MTKYLIKVIKIPDPSERFELASTRNMKSYVNEEYPLFTGEMNADAAVEVLDHLYKLKMNQE